MREFSEGAVAARLRSAAHHRYTAISRDGGRTWPDPVAVEAISHPVCRASVVELGNGRVVFANPSDPKRRFHLTLRLSRNDGAMWPFSRTLVKAPAAYSDLAAKGGTVYFLFETGEKSPYQRSRVALIPSGWWKP